MLMMATAGIFRFEQQEFVNPTEIHSAVGTTSRIVTAVDLNKSDHTHTAGSIDSDPADPGRPPRPPWMASQLG
jgi:hypothetical protein